MSELCQKCRLWKTSQTSNGIYSCNKLQGAGSSSADIMFVGDWPGDDEIQKKAVFVGYPGQLLRKAIKTSGIDEARCYFTYLCKCKPSFEKPPSKVEMNACLEYLQEEIRNLKPKVIVAIGSNVASTLGVKGSITSIHGQLASYQVPESDFKSDLMVLYHPSYVNNFVENSRQRKEFAQDLGKILRLANGEELFKKEEVNYKVAKTLQDVHDIVEHLLKAEWISYDCETTDLSCFKGKLLLTSFSDGPGKGYVIPYEYPGIFTEQERAIVKIELGRILGSNVKKIMQNGKFDIQFLFQYQIPIKMFVFDTCLAHYLLDENNPHGLASLVPAYTDMGMYKDEAHQYIVGNVKIPDGVDEKGKEKSRPSTILDFDYTKLCEYAAQDADATFRLYLKFWELLQKENLLKLLVQVITPVSYVLAQMEFAGIKGDSVYVETAAKQFSAEMLALEKAICMSPHVQKYLQKYNRAEPLSKRKFLNKGLDYDLITAKMAEFKYLLPRGDVNPTFFELSLDFKQWFPQYTEEQFEALEEMICTAAGKFNVNSTKQKRELLFDVMELVPVKSNRLTDKQREQGLTRGSESVDAEALQQLFEGNKIKVIDDILKYSKTKKFNEYLLNYKKLLEASVDGRIHTSYNQNVTATGRLSSSAPNLQNIPKRDKVKAKIVRRTFIAKEGYTLIEADFSQIEFKIWGHCSQDEKLLGMLENGFDIHYQIAASILHKAIEKVTEEERTAVKSVVYGMMYGRGAYSIAKELGMEEREVNRFVNGFFAMFPKAASWMDMNIAQMEKVGYIVNFMGRRRRALDIYSKKKEVKESAQRQARNAPLQSGSADLIYQVMIRIYKELLPYDAKLLMQIHDSLIFEVRDDLLPILLPLIKHVMENTVKLLCSTSVGIEIGKNLGEMTKLQFTDTTIDIASGVDEKGKKVFKPLYIIGAKEATTCA